MERKNRLVKIISNELINYSGKSIKIIYDNFLEMPALALLDTNTKEPLIIININILPDCKDTIAHILSHEYGHHILKHVDINPNLRSKKDLLICEDQADIYAAIFISKFNYNKDKIKEYIKLRGDNTSYDRIKLIDTIISN